MFMCEFAGKKQLFLSLDSQFHGIKNYTFFVVSVHLMLISALFVVLQVERNKYKIHLIVIGFCIC